MGVLCGLSVLWLLTDALHFGESRGYPRVSDALRKLDIEAIMFFLGEPEACSTCFQSCGMQPSPHAGACGRMHPHAPAWGCNRMP